MNTKPILFWPKARSEIALYLDRDSDDFSVVDTNSAYELQKLYSFRPDTPIFDPFPNHGDHYRDFIEHVVASDCHCRISGIKDCQDVLQALKDPLLARSPIDEIFAAIKPAGSSFGEYSSGAAIKGGSPIGSFLRRPIIVDWSSLNWANTSALAILAFAGTMIGIVVSPNNSLLAAVTAALLVAVVYAGMRTNFSKMFSWIAGSAVAKAPSTRKHGLLRLWAKR
jgi:hypothetical protein